MYQEYLEVALIAAKAGAEKLKELWGKARTLDTKISKVDLVTEADEASEKAVLDLLRHHYPSHSIVSEEAGLHPGTQEIWQWVLDPLDGTTNYSHQYPQVAVSLALLHDGAPVVAVVYNPFHEELFHATRGGGAFLNGKAIGVSKVDTLQKGLLATGFAYDRGVDGENNYAQFCHLTQISQGVRRAGSAALDLAYVGCGRLDAYWERGIKIWDVAAGALLVTEAGGTLTSYEGDICDLWSGRIIASNGPLHKPLLQALQEA